MAYNLGDRRFKLENEDGRHETQILLSADIFFTLDLSLTCWAVAILVLSVVLEELLRLSQASGKYIPRSRPCLDAVLPRIGA